MEPRLFSIEQSPRTVPAWDAILEDLGRPPPERVARVLGVSRSTVYRWHQEGTGPRIACLALFWLTRWGRSAVHTQATNDAILTAQLARSLGEDRAKLLRQVEALTHETRELAYDLAIMRRDELDRGSAATVGLNHRDTEPGGSWAAEAPPRQPQGLALDWPRLEPGRALPAPDPAAERPGSPAAPPPGAHSGRCPEPARTRQPAPSEHREVLPLSSPLVATCYQCEAILTSHNRPALTCFRCDKPGACGAVTPTSPDRQSTDRLAPPGAAAPRQGQPSAGAFDNPARPDAAQPGRTQTTPRRSHGAQLTTEASQPHRPQEPEQVPGACWSRPGTEPGEEPAPAPSPLPRPGRPVFLGKPRPAA